jgi:rod shape-determining protein MreD
MNYFITLFLAMSLSILPLPDSLSYLNPDWVLLVLIYWTLLMPEKTGVFNAWFVGILVDVLTGRLLGQHALIYALICYVCLKFHKRIRQYPVPQQSLCVFFCLFFSQMLMFWMENLQTPTEFSAAFWAPVFIGAFVWPFIYSTFRYSRLSGHHN